MPNQHEHGEIPFKVDRTEHHIQKDQNPVTGQYLRDLPPAISDDYDLWLRARGSEDDVLIEPQGTVEIKPGDHFYSSKKVITPGEAL